MTEGAVPQFHTTGPPRWGCLTRPHGVKNLVAEWTGYDVTFNERRTPLHLVPPWDYRGALPTSDTKLCLSNVMEQAGEWPGSHTAVFVALSIIEVKQQRFISHGSGVWKSKIKVLTALVSGETFLSGL